MGEAGIDGPNTVPDGAARPTQGDIDAALAAITDDADLTDETPVASS